VHPSDKKLDRKKIVKHQKHFIEKGVLASPTSNKSPPEMKQELKKESSSLSLQRPSIKPLGDSENNFLLSSSNLNPRSD
jgi:hypothetical protein